MIVKVRADLTSDERITIVADSFEIDGMDLLVYNGEEMVAAFRQWAYVVVDPPPELGGGTSQPQEAPTLKLPEPRPLNINPYSPVGQVA
jgi:hypothetical protein